MPARTGLLSAVILGAGLFPAAAHAQDAKTADEGFDLSGSARLRFEAIGGQARAGFDSDDTLVNLRTRLMLRYKANPIEAVVELYDSRVWGEDPGTPVTTGEVNTFEPVQAYIAADFGEALGKGSDLRLQAGRFKLDLGSRRLVAADDYRNTTNGYTGLRADLVTAGGIKAVLIYTLPQTRLPDDAASLRDARVKLDRESFDQVLWGGLASKPIAARVLGEIGFFHFGERDAPGRPTRDRSLNTASARVIADSKPGHFDFEAEAMYQWGSVSASQAPAAARQPVSAGFFHADSGYTFAGAWKPRLSAEFDYVSGDKPGGSYGRFDTLFGMRRGDLGPAGLYNAIGRANIVTPGVRMEVTPSKRLDAFATYHPMWLASRTDAFSTTGVRDATGQTGSFAGHQFDARLRYWLVPAQLRFEFNGVLLAKGRFLREAPNAPPDATTRYVAFDLTASF